MTTSYQDDPYLSAAVFAELERAMSDPFAQHLEKLEEVINRSERDGLCSEEVAQAAREKMGAWMKELSFLLVKTYLLHEQFRDAETMAAAAAHSRAAAPKA
jgi:hypothetical protein